MVIDEVQRAPDLLRAIKRTIDEDRRPGRFLLTGSVNLLLMEKVAESLAGRASYLELGTMTPRELDDRGADVGPWSALLRADSAQAAVAALSRRDPLSMPWPKLALRGGYPPAVTLDAEARSHWLQGYVDTYLERDLRQLSAIESLTGFRRLMQVAANRLGDLVNQADLARDADLNHVTAHRYMSLLETSFHLRRVPAFANNRTKRLVKAPKLYWSDAALCAHLAGLTDEASVRASGAYLEALVLRDLDTWRTTIAPRPEILHYRTVDGAEVDFVIEQGQRLLPIEIKTARQISGHDTKHLEAFLDAHSRARCGLLAYGGNDVYQLSERIAAMPVSVLLG